MSISALRLSDALSVSSSTPDSGGESSAAIRVACAGAWSATLADPTVTPRAVSSRLSSAAAFSAGSETLAPVPVGPARPSFTVSAPIGPMSAPTFADQPGTTRVRS